MSIGSAIVLAAVAFISTNIDDFCVLVIFFARAVTNNGMTRRDVIVGQTLGFTVITAFSLLGLILGTFIPSGYVEFIGFIPLFMGVQKAFEQCKEYRNAKINSTEDEGVAKEGGGGNEEGGNKDNDNDDDDDDIEGSYLAKLFKALFQRCLSPGTLEVGLVTVANGGDNVSIYLPLFATASPVGVLFTLLTFYVMLFFWLFLTYRLVNFRPLALVIQKYGRIGLPWLYMGLGLYVLSGCIVVTKYIIPATK